MNAIGMVENELSYVAGKGMITMPCAERFITQMLAVIAVVISLPAFCFSAEIPQFLRHRRIRFLRRGV